MTELLPCPWCGSEHIEWIDWYMACQNCGALGPSQLEGTTKEAAVAAWNTRADGWVNTMERIKKMMDSIMDQIPSSLDYGEDGRYTWPRRWEELKKYLDAEINLAKFSTPPDTWREK